MAATINFKVDQPTSKLFPAGHTKVLTSINQAPVGSYFRCGSGSTKNQSIAPLSTTIYIHAAAPTEPAGDGSVNTTDNTGLTATTYSGTGLIKSFTSEEGFFSVANNFDNHELKWTMTYVAYYTGTPESGYSPWIRYEFHKRDASNNDTKLFEIEPQIDALTSEKTHTFIVSGTVATTDRLRIKVYGGESLPV